MPTVSAKISWSHFDELLSIKDINKMRCYINVSERQNLSVLKKEHMGQIEVYMNYIDNNLKKITQDKTIGIIICKRDNKYIMEYCSDKIILPKEYEMVGI